MNAAEPPRRTILLVGDDPAVAMMLRDRLEPSGYSVWSVESATEGEAMADEVDPDLIIVDLMLPDTHGLVLCANLREKLSTPIIICSATTRKEDAILGLRLGADDFVAKPFSVDELLARVEAALRRTWSGAADSSRLKGSVQHVGQLVIDQARCRVTVGGRQVPLTPTEYRLLCALASRPDHVLSREELAERVWGSYDTGIGRSLEVHIRRLRGKLTDGTGCSSPLITHRGFGYRLVSETEQIAGVVGA
jgi:DNA-binding response OmpR family regulator